MQDGETTYAVDLTKREEPTDEEIASAGKRIKKKFYRSLDEITDQMIKLALQAEREDVRLRASSKILDDLSDRGRKDLPQGGFSVQIVNNIPIDRASVIEASEAQQIEWEGQKIGLPKKEIKRISPGESPEPGKLSEWRGDKQTAPSEVSVPVLPERNGKVK